MQLLVLAWSRLAATLRANVVDRSLPQLLDAGLIGLVAGIGGGFWLLLSWGGNSLVAAWVMVYALAYLLAAIWLSTQIDREKLKVLRRRSGGSPSK